MLAKVIQNRRSKCDRPHVFAARVAYPWKNAVAVETANLAGSWHDAAFQMQATADLAPFVKNPSYHIILSFSEVEHPSNREIFDAGHKAVEELGAHEHQYMMAIHKNRINIHLHILCNRVHPISGRVLSTSHNFARLELVCRTIEHTNGWPQDRGRFDCIFKDDKAVLVPKPEAHWDQKTRDRALGHRPDCRSVRRHEQRNGLPLLRDFLSPQALTRLRSQIEDATSWDDVHEALAKEPLEYQTHGTGARISRPGGLFFMPAGQLGTSCTFKSLEGRLGPFAVKKVSAERAEQKPIADPNPLPEAKEPSPIEAVVLSVKAKMKDVETWRRNRSEARNNLRAAQHAERRQVRNLLKGRRSLAAQALRKFMRAFHKKQAAELRHQHLPPHPLPLDATSLIGRLLPEELHRRRYRHVHRMRGMKSIRAPADHEHDHTAFRQAWCLARATDVALIKHELLKDALLSTTDIRVGGPGTLLVARRNSVGSIVGFDVCHEDNLATKPVHAKGAGEGLVLMGSRSAPTCITVPDTVTGLVLAATGSLSDKLIIVTPPLMTPRKKEQLHGLLEGRAMIHDVQSVLHASQRKENDLGRVYPKHSEIPDDESGTAHGSGSVDPDFDRGPVPF